ncbi:MAG: ABC transporter permease [Acidobacteria bacterium]|nr:MAG: ABC transporter permease [Acidobacteriota bacterium]
MRTVLAITRKELEQYFASPIAYVVVSFFLVLSGFFFFLYLKFYLQNVTMAGSMGQETNEVSQAIMRPFFSNIAFFFLSIFPLLTMRQVAEEKKLGTYELLMTSPVSVGQLVVGKFLGTVSFMAVILVLISIYPAVLFIFGHPDFGPIGTGFLGLLLLGSAFLSFGILFSALTESQIVAAVLGYVFFLILWIVNFLTSADTWYGKVLQYISVYQRFDDFTKGIVNLGDAVYYLSFAFFGLFVTAIVLQSQRWKS